MLREIHVREKYQATSYAGKGWYLINVFMKEEKLTILDKNDSHNPWKSEAS
jgi:hypothetical protein